MSEEETLTTRNYKNWPSNNLFLCGGRLLSGPDRYYFWASSFLLIFLGACFLIFVTPELYKADVVPRPWNMALIPIFLFFLDIYDCYA